MNTKQTPRAKAVVLTRFVRPYHLPSPKGMAGSVGEMSKKKRMNQILRESFVINAKSYPNKSAAWLLQFTADEMECDVDEIVEAIAEKGEISLA